MSAFKMVNERLVDEFNQTWDDEKILMLGYKNLSDRDHCIRKVSDAFADRYDNGGTQMVVYGDMDWLETKESMFYMRRLLPMSYRWMLTSGDYFNWYPSSDTVFFNCERWLSHMIAHPGKTMRDFWTEFGRYGGSVTFILPDEMCRDFSVFHSHHCNFYYAEELEDSFYLDVLFKDLSL